jgi:hypothetical protein
MPPIDPVYQVMVKSLTISPLRSLLTLKADNFITLSLYNLYRFTVSQFNSNGSIHYIRI